METPDTASGFTSADDETILKLKAENKTWAQIGEVVNGKDKNELRERYKELMAKKGESAAPAPVSPASDPGNAADTEEGGVRKGKGKGGKGKQFRPPLGVKEQVKEMEQDEAAPLRDENAKRGGNVILFDPDDGLDLEDVGYPNWPTRCCELIFCYYSWSSPIKSLRSTKGVNGLE